MPQLASSGCESLGAQHLIEASVHFLFFDQFATVGLCDALQHGIAITGIAFDQAQCDSSDKRLRVSPYRSGDSRKLRFLLWREMNFHAFQTTGERLGEQVNGRTASQNR